MEKYIANGRTFKTYKEVIEYAEKNNLRVSNTRTVNQTRFIIDLVSL
jgi:hypothetical protein